MKSLFASKTFWTNVVGLAAIAGSFYPPLAVLASPEIQAAIVGAGMTVANVGLRIVTDGPVSIPFIGK